tara:strand:+ start:1028 stop:1510 length:483 start_codon:yes stop_codon:yes gene_type:complete
MQADIESAADASGFPGRWSFLAAEALGIKVWQVQYARAVLHNGPPFIVDALREGFLLVSQAYQLLKVEPMETQRQQLAEMSRKNAGRRRDAAADAWVCVSRANDQRIVWQRWHGTNGKAGGKLQAMTDNERAELLNECRQAAAWLGHMADMIEGSTDVHG